MQAEALWILDDITAALLDEFGVGVLLISPEAQLLNTIAQSLDSHNPMWKLPSTRDFKSIRNN